MKRTIIAALVALTFISSGPVVFAQTANPTGPLKLRPSLNPTLSQMKQDIQQKREEVKSRVQTVRDEAQQKREEARQQVEANKEERLQNRCEAVKSRINFRLNQYETNRDKYHSGYQNIKTRLEDLTNQLEAKGCEVDQVRSDLTTLDGLITEFAASFRDFTTSLQGARQYACTEETTDFSGQVNTARQKVKVVQQKAEAVRTFFKNTLKPHVKSMATACRAQLEAEQGETQ